MVVASSAPSAPVAFDLKSANLSLVALVLKTTDLALLAQALDARLAEAPGLFDDDMVVVDLSSVNEAPEAIDFPALVALLGDRRMRPVAVRSGSAGQMEAALAAGLVEAHGQPPAPPARSAADAEGPVAEAAPEATPEAAPASSRTTLFVDKPLRSGQRVYAKGGDLVVLAVVSHGAEVIADGSIHVYAPLRGRALAGARGDTSARIFSTCMEPQLLSIAGIYRTTETELPADVLGQPGQVTLDGEKLVVEPLNID